MKLKDRMIEAISEGLDEGELSLDADEQGELAIKIATSVFDEFLISTDEQFLDLGLVAAETEDWK